MVEGGGQLKLASSDDPFAMENPTTIAGTIDDATGAMSDVTFSTPEINFQQDAGGLPVDITARFTTLSVSGNADGLGNVNVNAAVKLDVHVDVADGTVVTDCVSSPVDLALVSTAPYDATAQRVTLADPNFTVPPVADDGVCNALVSGPINDQLAGPGNSISLTMEGALALPPPPGDPSATTLTSSAASTSLGAPVTFTATVEPSDATGTVVFLDGTESIGQAALDDDATASVTTSTLPVGEHTITARFSGNVDYQGSVSAPVTHTVTATPVVTADIPPAVVVGADPVDFTATISNPSAGVAIPNLRVDMVFGQLLGLQADQLVLEWNDDGTWRPLTMAGTHTLTTSFPDATGFALNPGQSRTVQFRVSVVDGVLAVSAMGALPVKVTLVDVDPASTPPGAVLTTYNTVNATSSVVPATRYAVTAATGPDVSGALGTTGEGPIARVGDALRIRGAFTKAAGVPSAAQLTGTVDIVVDGQVLATGTISSGGSYNITVYSGPDSPLNDLAAGTRTVVAHYSGNSVFQGAVSPAATFALVPWVGERYTCSFGLPGNVPETYAVRVDVHADTPVSALPGTTVDLENLSINLWQQNRAFYAQYGSIGTDFTLSLSGGVTGTYTGVGVPATAAPSFEMDSPLIGATASVPIDGQPGDVIDVKYLGNSMNLPLLPGVALPLPCTAQGEGETIASITVAGTVLSTTASSPVVEGTRVPLTANVYPATAQGQVAFYDGDTLIGLALVNDGVATVNASGLSVGTHQITARYSGDLVNPASTSEALEVTVRDAIQCADQAQPGNPATVRATYLLLLGRCGDPGGFSFWVSQLDSGTSVETFAAQIANSLEAHRLSVDDAYQLVLHRAADPAGRNFWAQRLQNNGRYDVLVGDLAASAEFYNQAGGTNSGWVDLAYERILQRSPDAAGKAYWLGRLNAGESRSRIAATLVRLPEPTGTLVKEAYRAILDREPTAAELGAEVPLFQDTGSRAAIYARVIGTQEFVDDAQTFPNI